MRLLILLLAALPLALWAVQAPSAYQFVAASFLGGVGDTDAVVGCAIQTDGSIVLAANLAADFGAELATTEHRIGKPEDLGVVLRISKDGKKVLMLHRVAASLSDLSLDATDAIYLAAGDAGVIKLTPQADVVLWNHKTAGTCVRVAVGTDGHVATLVNGKPVLIDQEGKLVMTIDSPRSYNDVCLDGTSQTIIATGFRNADAFDGKQIYPVQISYLKGFGYDGKEKWSDYDWDTDTKSDRFINRSENNMADSRGYRCTIGRDGKLYAAFEVAGGNHIFRYQPTDIMKKSAIVKAENDGQYHTLYAGGASHRTVFGRFDPATGALDCLQQFTSRSSAGRGGNIRMKAGNLTADEDGRPFLAENADPSIPIDPNPCAKEEPQAGPFMMGMSVDLKRRLVCTRLQGVSGFAHCVDVRRVDDTVMIVYAGSSATAGMFVKDSLQGTPIGKDGFFAILRGPVDAPVSRDKSSTALTDSVGPKAVLHTDQTLAQ